MKKNFKVFFIFFLIVISSIFFYLKFTKKNLNENLAIEEEKHEEKSYNLNVIKNVNYQSKDSRGNEYIIDALKGEIDISNSNIIFLSNVKALIIMNNSENITITSDYGKYNINNYDTIFSKNVVIEYLDNRITSDYADFSIGRNSMIISKNVVYTNLENILKADVIKINIETKDTIIYMHEENKKVNIKTKK